MRDGSKIIGKLIKKTPAGIIIIQKEYYAFATEKTISIEMFIPHTDIKTIQKKNLLF